MKCSLEEWQQKEKPISEMIVQASDMTGKDEWRVWPIGMSWQFTIHHKKGRVLQIGNHEHLVLSTVRVGTDKARRPEVLNRQSIIKTLEKNGITNELLYPKDYFLALPSYKFVVSPEGNGIDCHRHYEAFMAGCIPIIEINPLTQEKYKDCPVLWTTDYSEITKPYLEQVYKEMKSKVYDFSCLFLSHYDTRTQEHIKMSANFWLASMSATRSNWY
jgi:hypothetical protein